MAVAELSSLLSVFFRISDSPTPEKCCQREVCFINFLSVFQGVPITVIADNVGPKTLAIVSQPGIKVIETKLGNCGSFLKTLDLACEADTMFAYFCEDDYIHRDDAARLVIEGLRWSNYITLYDHPDKYLKERGYGEVGRCLKTESWHWRQTISTTNTFGANLGILRQDMDVFHKHSTGVKVPNDHGQWCELAQKKRTLTVSIPGAAFNTHRVCEHSGFDWGASWAGQQIKKVGDMFKKVDVFQPPPKDVVFQPCELIVKKKDVGKPTNPDLPNLAEIGKTTEYPPGTGAEAPVDSQEPTKASEPSKIRKKLQVPDNARPLLAIPNPTLWHTAYSARKKFEVQEGNFGAFVPVEPAVCTPNPTPN